MKEGDETITSPGKPEHESTSDNEEILSSPSMAHAHSTPRMPSTAKQSRPKPTSVPAQPQFAEYPSPYEQLRREMEGKSGEVASRTQPVTPGKGQVLPDMSMTPDTSPFVIHRNGEPSTAQKNADAILHQGILSKTYRVAATPHTARKTKNVTHGATPATANRTRRAWIDESLSSPNEPSPQLRTEIFLSPFKGPRTPGVSVVTPAAKKRFADFAKPEARVANSKDKTMSKAEEMTMSLRAQWDEDDEELEMSPPKTIHFNIPQSQLLRTPGTMAAYEVVLRTVADSFTAQEASKRIMEDLLLTAGGDITEELDEDSPSIVQRNRELDETF